MKDVIELLYNSVLAHPDQSCVIEGEAEISYRAFWERARIAAKRIAEMDPTPKVVLDLPQGIDACCLIVATLMANGCWCPLNVTSPPARKQTIIDSFCPHIIISRDWKGEGGLTPEQLFDPREYPEVDLTEHWPGDSDPLAYVIFTSGSTGTPKGVQVNRKSLNAFLDWAVPAYHPQVGDRWGQFSYLSFDISIIDLFVPWATGATVVTLGAMAHRLRPSGAVEKFRLTYWQSVPGVIDFMIKNEEVREMDLSSLKTMSFGGEPLKQYQVEFLFSKSPSLRIFNTYGTTEGTLIQTRAVFDRNTYSKFMDKRGNLSIGKPIPGWNIHLEPVEDDLKEIVLYGNYLGRGYLQGDASAFTTLKWEDTEYPAFHTGDLVYEKAGLLFFGNRADHQVKVWGHRVELEEIDFWIRKCTGLSTLTLEQDNQLYAFLETSEPIDPEGIKAYLRNKLEPIKIPAFYFPLPAFPRSENLKVDRKALRTLIRDFFP